MGLKAEGRRQKSKERRKKTELTFFNLLTSLPNYIVQGGLRSSDPKIFTLKIAVVPINIRSALQLQPVLLHLIVKRFAVDIKYRCRFALVVAYFFEGC